MTRRVTWSALIATLIALGTSTIVGISGLASCADRDDGNTARDNVRLPEPDDAIDESLMLALAVAKNFHHEAKVYMADGKPALAIEAVRKILSIEFPPGSPEGEDVRLDAHALLAKLLLGQNDLVNAMTAVEEGIKAGTRNSFFLANLHTVKGEVLQAQAKVLEASLPAPLSDADKDKVSAVRRLAIEAFEYSNTIIVPLQERLYQQIKEERR